MDITNLVPLELDLRATRRRHGNDTFIHRELYAVTGSPASRGSFSEDIIGWWSLLIANGRGTADTRALDAANIRRTKI
jgi:hypothetical protein